MTRQILNQAQRVRREISNQGGGLKALGQQLGVMTDRVKQVIRQTRARVLRGETHRPDKLVSVFEPHTEIIRKGKALMPRP